MQNADSSHSEKPADVPTGVQVGFRISTTAPPEVVGHWVLDEQLEMLGDANRDGLLEAFWAFVGAALAGSPAAIAALWNAISSTSHAMQALDVVEVVIPFTCGAVALTIRIISGRRSATAKGIISEIRGRRKT
jgi:hypothetical protein